jgi:hypothetical protein
MVTGGGFVLPGEWGRIKDSPRFQKTAGKTSLPDPGTLTIKTPGRWGRFDDFTRLGYISVALALKDGENALKKQSKCGIVVYS